MRYSLRLAIFLCLVSFFVVWQTARLLVLYLGPGPELKSRNRDHGDDEFAYVFYATSNLYACSVMVNIHRLRRLFHTPHPIYLLVSDEVSIRYKSVFRERYNVTIIEHEPHALPMGSAPYYKDVMLKLVAFKLYVWAPMVKRVIVLDGDVLVLRSLDSLFGRVELELETGQHGGVDSDVDVDVDVAAPHAYWLGGPVLGVTSAMMMVRLSEGLWARMEAMLEGVRLESRVDVYDMDLINQEFFGAGGPDGDGDGDGEGKGDRNGHGHGHDGLVLPGEFCTLNSHWEVGEVPAWSRFRQDHIRWPPEGRRALSIGRRDRAVRKLEEQDGKQGRRLSLRSMLESRSRSGAQGQRSRDEEEEAKRNGNGTLTDGHRTQPGELKGDASVLRYDPALVDPLTSIFHNDVYVLHFTALGKPWSFTVQSVHRMRPDAHPLFAEQFLLWRRAAKYVCPALGLDERGGNEVVGKKWNYGDEGGEGAGYGYGYGYGYIPPEPVTGRFLDDV
nr:hypothetical protein LTR18_004040 [Exophiala xenobiotica]